MGGFRKARREELGQLIALTERVFRQDGFPALETSQYPIFAEDNADHWLIVEEDGQPVSFAGLKPGVLHIAGCQIPVASMGLVCTDAAFRGQGYASLLVRRAIEQLEAEGKAFVMISGNRDLYVRHEAENVGRVYRFHIPMKDLAAAWARLSEDPQFEAGAFQPDDLAGMLRVLRGEEACFERTPQSFMQLIESRTICRWYDAEQHIWVGRKSGIPECYIVMAAWRSNDGKDAEIIEAAGPDESLMRLIKEASARLDVSNLTLCLPHYRKELADKLACLGYSNGIEPMYGTIRMISLPVLWNCLRPYLQHRLGEQCSSLKCAAAAGGCRISMGNENLVLNNRAAAQLVFNGSFGGNRGPLQSALETLFPLPMVTPFSLNYI